LAVPDKIVEVFESLAVPHKIVEVFESLAVPHKIVEVFESLAVPQFSLLEIILLSSYKTKLFKL
jgi:hypothetical protein